MAIQRLRDTPSWRSGYARNKWESAYPERWDGCVTAYAPALGNTGAVLRDLSGSERDAQNGAPFGTGQNGPCVFCSEEVSTKYFSFTPPPPCSAASMVLWLRCNSATPSTSSAAGFVTLNSDSGSSSHYPYTSGLAYMNVFRVSRINLITLDASVDRAQWHTVSVTTKPGANGWNLYQNNKLVRSDTGEDAVAWPALCRIGISAQTSYRFSGQIALALLYNRALAAPEIAAIAADPLGMFRLRPRPVFYNIQTEAPASTLFRRGLGSRIGSRSVRMW